MWLITDWLVHSWGLLQIRGWWFAVGLIFGAVVMVLPLRAEQKQKNGILCWPVVCGALLPVCNFATVPLAVVLLNRGMGTGAVFAFFSAAVLLNPSGILSAWAYMGPTVTTAYLFTAISAAWLAGMAGNRCLEQKAQKQEKSVSAYVRLSTRLAVWMLLGILAQALLLTLAPADIWQNIVGNPQGASFLEIAMAGIFRHVCIPDDVSLIASLVASGLRPGCAVLFLIIGICTNLPELFVLYGMAGKKPAALYLLVTAAVGIAGAALTECLIGADFVPQFNLAGAAAYTDLANLLSIRTWMPAKIPCAIVLLLFAALGLWNRRKKEIVF